MIWTNMELLPLVCLCLLTWSGTTFADGNETEIIRVSAGSDVTLPCSVKEDVEQKRFEWMKDGLKEVFLFDRAPQPRQDPEFARRVSYFQEELRNGNASITIRDTKMADSGNYTCDFPGRQTSHIQLVVGAAVNPSVITLRVTQDWAALQCVVRGASPQTEVEWQDGSGHNLTAQLQVFDRDGRYDIILQTTVTKTDIYRCVATQKEISHQTHAWTYVFICGRHSGLVAGVAVGAVLGTLVVVGVVLAVLRARGYRCIKGSRSNTF
ncbi:CD276 antigen-like [Lates calcarifer]|uniref:CD276 antigen-like n=1 Tax=Lates calcarifer TaxID=8187 RepID=A0AAJ8DLD8_LATCA|nr:CD276 antigen-like [Lates calcarifer]